MAAGDIFQIVPIVQADQDGSPFTLTVGEQESYMLNVVFLA